MSDFFIFHERKIIFAITLAAFFISIIYSLSYRIEPIVDAKAYDATGWNIGQGLGYFGNSPNPAEDSVIRHPGPGYQYFLGGVYSLFGHSYKAVWIIQALLHALSVFLVFFITKYIFRSVWHPQIGIFASALVAFSPDLILASAMLMTENVAIFLMLLGIAVFLFGVLREYRWLVFVSAVVLALAVMTRSTTLLTIIPLIGYLLYKKAYSNTALFLGIFCLMFVPWTLFTYKIYGELLPLGANLGLNLSSGNYHGASGELDPSYVRPNSYDELGPVKSEHALREEAITFIKENPFEFLKLTLYRTSIYFSFLRPTGWWPYLQGIDRTVTLLLSFIYSVILFTFGGAGIWALLKERDVTQKIGDTFWLLLSLTAALPLGVVFITVETRYRYPIYPFLAMFAGYGLYTLWQRRVLFWVFLYTFGILSLNTLFDGLRNISRIFERFHSL